MASAILRIIRQGREKGKREKFSVQRAVYSVQRGWESEVRRRTTEDRRQTTEDRRQTTEDGKDISVSGHQEIRLSGGRISGEQESGGDRQGEYFKFTRVDSKSSGGGTGQWNGLQ
ncbi:hypothetical protein ES703_10752 [subsurface metagenome]